MKLLFQDFLFWYKKQAPQYGYFRTIFDAWWNCRHFQRDGKYKKRVDKTL